MILRTYGCDCGYEMTVELRSDQWNEPPPNCPACESETRQEMVPPNIGGSNRARAVKMAESIAAEDYGVADMKLDGRGGPNRVRYRDQSTPPSTWGANREALDQAVTIGRETRIRHGNALDMLKRGIKDGSIPDVIAQSKAKSARIW